MFLKRIFAVLAVGVMLSTAFLSTSAKAEFAPPTGEIVGGIEANRGAWPFMAAMITAGSNPRNGQFCGGTLIAPGWVLSAAHCFQDRGQVTPASQVQVALGYHDLRNDVAEIKNVSRIIVHPNYNESSYENDIALLELASFSNQTPALLVSSGTNLTGLTGTAIGWGLTIEGDGNSTPDILRQVSIPIVSNATCNSVYGSITSVMVCAGLAEGGQDACQGDSGGPLVISEDGVTKLVGVTSFGNGCAQPNAYGVYARVASFESFISQYVVLGRTDPTDGDFGLWNGYLGMFNIVELQNRSNFPVTGQVNIFNIQGTLVSSSYVDIAARSQVDIILNGRAGFQADSYGIVQISSNVEGRIFYYRPIGGGFSNFEYVAGVKLTPAQSGSSFVGYNTFQPSSNLLELGNTVANWLSIVNLSATTQNFSVRKYDFNGVLLNTATIPVAPNSRVDLDGGHIFPGPAQVGLLEVIPQSGSTRYLAQLWRYGYGSNGSFDFAFPLIARAGSNTLITVPLGSTLSTQNWLEVASTAGPVTVDVSFYTANGALVGTETRNLPARGQFHFDATQQLGGLGIGYARIQPRTAVRLVAQSMFYFRNAASGGIASMYGSQAAPPVTSAANGSYNLFLGMENYLKLSNPNNSAVNVNVTVSSNASVGSSRTITLPANSSRELLLHNTVEYGTALNTYGVVSVTPSGGVGLTHEVLRLKRDVFGGVEFAAPTALD